MPNHDGSLAGEVDLHVHVGQWSDRYFDPLTIGAYLLDERRLSGIGVSSLSACRSEYILEDLVAEIHTMNTRWPNKIFHWLWLRPDHLETLERIKSLKIPVHGLKVHPYTHDWDSRHGALDKVCMFADKNDLPILIHTGGSERANAGRFMNLCRHYTNTKFIFAHARPFSEAKQLAYSCENAFFDISFVQEENIIEAVQEGLIERFYYGTDYPINGVIYPENEPLRLHYIQKKMLEPTMLNSKRLFNYQLDISDDEI